MARSDHSSIFQPFLERLVSRSELSPEERSAILDLPAKQMSFAAHRDIVRMGDNRSHSSLVMEGVIGRFMQNTQGERQLTALHLPGEMADLDGVVHPDAEYGLQALSGATIAQVPHAALRAAAMRYPAIAEAFWRQSASDLVNVSRWALHLGRSTARTRIANLFCEVAVRLGGAGGPKLEFSLPITQEQLAEATGLTSVHVNRTLKGLRVEGVVNFKLREVQIGNWELLAEAGEFSLAQL